MSYLWRHIRNIMGGVGMVLGFLGASTGDRYAEMGMEDPTHVWILMGVGLMMTLPLVVHLIRREFDL